jgi:hypothetical protein
MFSETLPEDTDGGGQKHDGTRDPEDGEEEKENGRALSPKGAVERIEAPGAKRPQPDEHQRGADDRAQNASGRCQRRVMAPAQRRA